MAESFEWDDVRFFLAVSRAENLTQAARQLRVSQPTVGRRIKALEDRLGKALFERLPDRLALTEAGRALLPFAEEMEQQTFGLSHALDGLSEQADRLVRVTAIASFAVFLTRAFDDIERRCAPFAIEIVSTGERLNLARKEADIAFRMNSVPSRGDLISRRVGSMAYALYANRVLAGELDPDDPAAIRRSRFVGYRRNPRKRSQSGWLFDFGAEGDFPLRVNELFLRYEAARHGFGITILPCHLGDACADLVRVHPPIEELTEDIYLLMHAREKAAAPVRRVAEALVEVIQQRQDQLLGR